MNCTCDILIPGLIELIKYSYQQVVTFFPKVDLQRTLRLSVLGLKQFEDTSLPTRAPAQVNN